MQLTFGGYVWSQLAAAKSQIDDAQPRWSRRSRRSTACSKRPAADSAPRPTIYDPQAPYQQVRNK